MPTVEPFAVIITVDAAADVMPDLEAHARYGLTRFPEFEGFISGRLHKSADGTRIVQHVCWRSEANHLACVDDPRWEGLASTRRFFQIVESGQADVDVQTYRVIAEVPDGADVS